MSGAPSNEYGHTLLRFSHGKSKWRVTAKHGSTLAGIAGAVPSLFHLTAQTPKAPNYEVQGTGPTLILGLDNGLHSAVPKGYLDGLTDRYRVIVTDYPPSDDDARAVESSFTPDHVCADVLAVADTAGAERFAWFGYSWGGVVGLRLATRTRRLTAMICGGWPAVGAPFARWPVCRGPSPSALGNPRSGPRSTMDWSGGPNAMRCQKFAFHE